jgi:threonine synthase
VTLGEGATPLVPLPRLSARLGLAVLVKLEGMNPTASFKDRGMTMAVSKAVEEGASAVICASTGNTSASRGRLRGPRRPDGRGRDPGGQDRRRQARPGDATARACWRWTAASTTPCAVVRALAERHPIALVNSLNEYRIDGQRTRRFEVCDALGDAPDALCIPVGNAGNVSAYWLGFQAYREARALARLPRLYGFQAAGAAPLVDGAPVERPETVATAIRIGKPARGAQALAAMRESRGGVAAGHGLGDPRGVPECSAAEEGIFCEPASAASVRRADEARRGRAAWPGRDASSACSPATA